MELLLALTIGTLIASGTFLMLRPRGFPVVQGLVLISHGINILLVTVGHVQVGAPPILQDGTTVYADPLAQALVLTAIVISFGMTAFVLVLAYQGYRRSGTERVDIEVKHG